jgi:hypothetical protein
VYSNEPKALREFALSSSDSINLALSADVYSDAAAVFGYLVGQLSATQVAHFCTRGGSETIEQHVLFAIATDSATSDEDAETIFSLLCDVGYVEGFSLRRDATLHLERLLSKIPSDLRQIETWRELRLPPKLFEMVRQAS